MLIIILEILFIVISVVVGGCIGYYIAIKDIGKSNKECKKLYKEIEEKLSVKFPER